jgi:hypothetical protein
VMLKSAEVRTYIPEKKQKGQRDWDGKGEQHTLRSLAAGSHRPPLASGAQYSLRSYTYDSYCSTTLPSLTKVLPTCKLSPINKSIMSPVGGLSAKSGPPRPFTN